MLRLPLLLSCLLALAACAPSQRLAAYEPLTTRYELLTLEYPASIATWYDCFQDEDALARQRCLADCPGVRASTAPGLACAEPADPALLCRAFPLEPPQNESDGQSASTDEDEDSGVGQVIGDLIVGLFTAAIEGDEDDDDDDDDAKAKAERSERTKPAKHRAHQERARESRRSRKAR